MHQKKACQGTYIAIRYEYLAGTSSNREVTGLPRAGQISTTLLFGKSPRTTGGFGFQARSWADRMPAWAEPALADLRVSGDSSSLRSIHAMHLVSTLGTRQLVGHDRFPHAVPAQVPVVRGAVVDVV